MERRDFVIAAAGASVAAAAWWHRAFAASLAPGTIEGAQASRHASAHFAPDPQRGLQPGAIPSAARPSSAPHRAASR